MSDSASGIPNAMAPAEIIAALQHQLWRNHTASTTCDGCRKTIDILNRLTSAKEAS